MLKSVTLNGVNPNLDGVYNLDNLNLREEHQVTQISGQVPPMFDLAVQSEVAAMKVALAVVGLGRDDKDAEGVAEALWEAPAAAITVQLEADEPSPLEVKPGDGGSEETASPGNGSEPVSASPVPTPEPTGVQT